MDSSHVALVSLYLQKSGFASFQVDRPQTFGLSITHLAKVMKLVSAEDSIILKAEENPTHITIIFQNESKTRIFIRFSNYRSRPKD